MPHESTVNPFEPISDDFGQMNNRSRIPSHCSYGSETPTGLSASNMATLTQQVAASKLASSTEFEHKPETPSALTHHEDFDDDDEDSDESKSTTLLESTP